VLHIYIYDISSLRVNTSAHCSVSRLTVISSLLVYKLLLNTDNNEDNNKQDNKLAYNVTLRGVFATIVAVEKQ